ncbi:uncharacterized protein E0L32_005026 [Thyridium curvatum]|uniref:Uncharacterized protein n=1 Tax=Thyridium curvatum TaxID=1093900 RepID=A0A507B583_9PEZI|nr:uncharacterized protein E0L32_005026 [Thyridium curvatum]TPX14917.1 hypothetical protein E0L32_005026 [Thyridium curvatum]
MVRKTNVTATRAVDGLTPKGSFLNDVFPGQGNKPDLSRERICGSQVTLHIPQERKLRWHKFGSRGETGIYLSMEGSQIYTCWVPSRGNSHQTVRSANVTIYKRVGEKDLPAETTYDAKPMIHTNKPLISSQLQSATEQSKTSSPNQTEVNNIQHTEVHNPQYGQTKASMTSAKLPPDPRERGITKLRTITETLQGPHRERTSSERPHSELPGLLTKGTWRILTATKLAIGHSQSRGIRSQKEQER